MEVMNRNISVPQEKKMASKWNFNEWNGFGSWSDKHPVMVNFISQLK